MKPFWLSLFLLLSSRMFAQVLSIQPDVLDAGSVPEAGSLRTYAVLKNESSDIQYLLRAVSSRQTDVFVSRKKLLPGDTLHLQILHRPIHAGMLNEDIELYISGEEHPIKLKLIGEIGEVIQNELQACVSFAPKLQIAGREKGAEIRFPVTQVPLPTGGPDETLDPAVFAPVNLIMLIDLSGSMKDEQKLPVLKKSMTQVYKTLRPIDRVSIVTYASDVKVRAKGIRGNHRDTLALISDSMMAGGLTAGSQGLKLAYELADELYIEGGNNQIILATDGNFGVRNAERKIIEARARDPQRPLTLSVLAYGEQQEYHKRLKHLTEMGNGSFIHVKKAGNAETLLLEEIKMQAARARSKGSQSKIK